MGCRACRQVCWAECIGRGDTRLLGGGSLAGRASDESRTRQVDFLRVNRICDDSLRERLYRTAKISKGLPVETAARPASACSPRPARPACPACPARPSGRPSTPSARNSPAQPGMLCTPPSTPPCTPRMRHATPQPGPKRGHVTSPLPLQLVPPPPPHPAHAMESIGLRCVKHHSGFS